MSSQIDAVISYCRCLIKELKKQKFEITLEDIEKTVQETPFFETLSEADIEHVIRTLEYNFNITQAVGSSVRFDYKPWLKERQQSQTIDSYYWPRLQTYLLEEEILPPDIISTLDKDTDDILDYSGNPDDLTPWKRRGMVMGHVQSGKTTNYSALICKAADAGYKIIILLAGITNTLRAQTQTRLDESFIGKKSFFQVVVPEMMTLMNYAVQKRYPHYGTSRESDFTKTVSSFGVSLKGLSEPIIFITKKNKSILQRLKEWIPDANDSELIDEPLLLIDDEADNASINTSQDPFKTTAINAEINAILKLFKRSTYIGYTGTPFANIFIDPNTQTKMVQDDLFPRHFIKALAPPNNYAGATRVFSKEGDLNLKMINILEDRQDNYMDVLPLKHKSDQDVFELPISLYSAIRVFILTRAIRVLRGQGNKHCSMMINVSRFNKVQSEVEGLVYQYLTKLKNSITVNSSAATSLFEDPHIQALKNDFDEEFSTLEFDFAQILASLNSAVASIQVITVNMKKKGKLEYDKHEGDGLHVIAIGGLALSRGLTLEGLTVSYILRNASASDTLMQMARWFGYRIGYEDVCRLYLPQASYDHYEQITEATEELRAEIDIMDSLGKTPEEFGLKVRQSPTGIRITAANKMRTASELVISQDYSGKHIEGHAIYNDKEINEQHKKLITIFLDKLGQEDEKNSKYILWKNVSGEVIQDLVLNFKFPSFQRHLSKITNTHSLVDDYISDRVNADLKYWDVALPIKGNGTSFSEIYTKSEVNFRSRNQAKLDGDSVRIYGQKNRVAQPGDVTIGMGPAELSQSNSLKEQGHKGDTKYCLARKSPILLIHVFSLDSQGQESIAIRNPGISLSLGFTATTVRPIERTYHINQIYKNNLLKPIFDDEDEDDISSGEI